MARAYATLRRTAATGSTARSSATSRARSSASPTPTARPCKSNNTVRRRALDGSTDGNARDRGPAAAGRRPVRHRHGRAASRLRGRRQDRHDRELRRCVVRRLHAATRHRGVGRLPERARADDDRVPRPPGRRRHLSGADLEGVHGRRRSPYRRTRADVVPGRRRSSTRRRRRVVFRDGRLELDNGDCRGAATIDFFAGSAPTTSRTASRTRSRCRTCAGRRSRRRRRVSRPAAPAAVVYKPAKPGQRSASSSGRSRAAGRSRRTTG